MLTPQRRVGAISLCLFLVFFGAYCASPVRTSADSRWSIATAMSFAQGHHGSLAGYLPVLQHENLYAIEYHDSEPYSIFPMGTSLLSVPFVWLASVISPGFADYLVHAVPAQFEGVLASLYGAVACVLFFLLIEAKFRNFWIALVSAAIFGFGTSMWSTATRALWMHGPLMLMLTAAMLILVRAPRKPAWTQYLGLFLAAAYVIRPTAAVPIILITAYVAICYRPWLMRYLVGAAVVAVPWFALNLSIFHHFLPPYYMPQRITGSVTFGTALLGNLVSPARGIFVFSPVLLAALPGVWLALRERGSRALHSVFAAIIVLHWVAISRFPHWWGGYSFGPRLMADVLPFLVYFTSFSIRWAAGLYHTATRRIAVGTIGVLACLSVGIHAQGALTWAPHAWSAAPLSIDAHPERLWDWSDLQFARGFIEPVPMPDFGPWLPGLKADCPAGILNAKPDVAISLRGRDIAPDCLAAGWSSPEQWGTWQEGPAASLRIAISQGFGGAGGLNLVADARGFASLRWPQDDVDVLANGVTVARWSFTLAAEAGERRATIPPGTLQHGALTITFRPVSPHSPAEAGVSADARRLGIGITSLRLLPR